MEPTEMPHARRRLLPWFIGVGLIVLADIATKIAFFTTDCQAPGIAQFLVLVALPAVYIGLAFLAFKSQP